MSRVLSNLVFVCLGSVMAPIIEIFPLGDDNILLLSVVIHQRVGGRRARLLHHAPQRLQTLHT